MTLIHLLLILAIVAWTMDNGHLTIPATDNGQLTILATDNGHNQTIGYGVFLSLSVGG